MCVCVCCQLVSACWCISFIHYSSSVYYLFFHPCLLSVCWFAGWSVSSITQNNWKDSNWERDRSTDFFSLTFSNIVRQFFFISQVIMHGSWFKNTNKNLAYLGSWYLSELKKRLMGLGEVLHSTGFCSSLQHLTCQSFLLISLYRLFFLECWSRLWTAETRWLRSI